MALAGDEHHVAGRRVEHGALDRAAAVELDDHLGAAAGEAGEDRRRRSRAGSSLRGLSLVTMATSASRPTASPIERALLGIAVAAAAEDADEPARAARPRTLREHARERVGRVRVVDEHDHVVAPGASQRSSRPGTAMARGERARRARDVEVEEAARWRAPRAGSTTLCAPRSGERIETGPAGVRASSSIPAARVRERDGRDLGGPGPAPASAEKRTSGARERRASLAGEPGAGRRGRRR